MEGSGSLLPGNHCLQRNAKARLVAGFFLVITYRTNKMRKIEAQTIQAVRDLLWMPEFTGCHWRSGNMDVSQSHNSISGKLGYERIISVRLHGNEIFALRPDCQHIWVSDCNYQTATTKSRLNALLGCFSSGFCVFQKRGQWYFQGKTWDCADKWTGSQSVSFRLNADNWMLQQAEKLAVSKLEKQTGVSRDGSHYT